MICFEMGQNCENCGKLMKNYEMSHCSDECLFRSITNSISLNDDQGNAISWDDATDPWR